MKLLILAVMMVTVTPHAKQVTVHYEDLNLQQDSDVRVLYGRIQHAARELCAEEWQGEDKCREEAIRRAVEKVGNDPLRHLNDG
jgi:UrcA family protein